jgi:hypothetical protein
MGAARVDRDNSAIAVTNYARFTPVEGLTANVSADMVRDCLKVDLFRLSNP